MLRAIQAKPSTSVMMLHYQQICGTDHKAHERQKSQEIKEDVGQKGQEIKDDVGLQFQEISTEA